MAAAAPAERARLEGVNWASRDAIGERIVEAEAEYQRLAAEAKRRRADGWNRWVQDALADGAGRLYKWIRAGGPPAPGLVPDPAGVAEEAQGPAQVGTR
eukprot:11209883-Lingulodinium_polyedra.AAC.1